MLLLVPALVLLGCRRSEEVGLCGEERTGPLNVVLVSLDTVRADHLSVYGYPRNTSPNLDQLATEAVVFERAIAQAPLTLPSHLSLFQSRFASLTSPLQPQGAAAPEPEPVSEVGDYGPSGAPMLAEVLGQAGWRTAAFTGGAHVSAKLGFDRGFGIYQDHPRSFARSLPAFRSWLTEQATREEPFFAFLHSYDAHLPYSPPEPYETYFTDPAYEGEIWDVATRELALRVRGRGKFEQFRRQRGSFAVEEADRRQMVDLYDGGLRYTDTWIGQLLELLGTLEVLENTVVVILSDHGEELWDHRSFSHGHTLYQELLHVPLILRLPQGCHGGQRIRKTVMLLDVAPSILELLGLPPQPTHQGKSLLPLILRDGTWPRRPIRPIISELGFRASVLRGRHKLVWNRILSKGVLFNLGTDPNEHRPIGGPVPTRRAVALKADLDFVLKSLQKVSNDSEQIDDPELVKQLKALGYLD